jgi:transcription initiation factor TFIIIB Brf1 subunit/transcription initiation factor TFIIB
VEHKITHTSNEIASMFQLQTSEIGYGERILQSLNEIGVISVRTCIDPIADFVKRYLHVLEIFDDNYLKFILEIIQLAENMNLHVMYDSQNSSKAVGGIYLLIDRVPKLKSRISKNIIEVKCQLSKTTFTRYYKLIISHYHLFLPIFAKYKIPVKNEWISRTTPKRIDAVTYRSLTEYEASNSQLVNYEAIACNALPEFQYNSEK